MKGKREKKSFFILINGIHVRNYQSVWEMIWQGTVNKHEYLSKKNKQSMWCKLNESALLSCLLGICDEMDSADGFDGWL